MKGIDRFNKISERYKEAYFKSNHERVLNLEYKNGFVWVTTNDGNAMWVSKYRIGAFEQILNRLENQISNK